MENHSHSRLRVNHKQKTSYGKSNISFPANTTSDGYLNGDTAKVEVRTLSPCAEDYSEIFGSFNGTCASSIPVLDLPVLDDSEVFFDVRGSSFDYAEVFGGFDTLDYAVSYEELFEQSNGGGGVNDCFDEARWSRDEIESLSKLPDHSIKNASLQLGDPYQSVEGSTEFRMSYYKGTERFNEKSDGQTCMGQLDAVRGYTYIATENTHLQKTENEKPSLKVSGYRNHTADSSQEMEGIHVTKTISHPPHGSTGRKTFSGDLRRQGEFQIDDYHSNEMFVSVSEVSLRTKPSNLPPPSRTPPLLDVNKGYSVLVTNSSEETGSEGLHPYRNVAALSAAAMEEAMMKAQAKLIGAKELMERKKEGLRSRTKSGSNNSIEDKKGKERNTTSRADLNFEFMEGVSEREVNVIEQSACEETQNFGRAIKSVSEFSRRELLNVAHRNEKESGSSRVSDGDGAGEWKDATPFFKLVNTDNPTKMLERASNEKTWGHNGKVSEGGQMKDNAAIEALGQQEDTLKRVEEVEDIKVSETGQMKDKTATGVHGQQEDTLKKVEEVEENCEVNEYKMFKAENEAREPAENNVRLKAAKTNDAHSLKGGEKNVKVTREVCCLEEKNDLNSVLDQWYVDAENNSTGSYELKKHEALVKVESKEDKFEADFVLKQKVSEQKLKVTNPRTGNDKRLEESHRSEDSAATHEVVLEKKDEDKWLKETTGPAKSMKRPMVTFEHEQNEMLKEKNENEQKVKEAREIEENEKKLREALEHVENEMKLKEALEHAVNKKRQLEEIDGQKNEKELREVHKCGEHEKKLREAHKREENEKEFKEVYRIEDSEKRLKEVCEQEDIIINLKEHQAMEESVTGTKEVCEVEETDKNSKEGTDRVELKEMKDRQQHIYKMECPKENGAQLEDICLFRETLNLDKIKNFLPTQSASKNENSRKDEDAVKPFLCHANVKKVCETGRDSRQVGVKKIKSVFAPFDSSPEYQVNKLTHKPSKTGNTIKQVHVDPNQVENTGNFMSTQVGNEGCDGEGKVKAGPEEKVGVKQSGPRTGQQTNNNSQKTEGDENILNETITTGDKENKTKKTERALEKDRLRKLEEERERDRERKKDRMAIDRAAIESREWAYKESRERADRAAFNQRVLAEASERLEKVCAEVREKSLYEKTSVESRRNAGRAAVGRTTADTPDCAAKKAMAEKDSWDMHLQSMSSSTVYSASSTEKSEGVGCESAQRCKARLERHQRMAERAAKALAEKNMRDLIVQKEQEEINRLAESLDADVKRWSNGKERNLRALVSTMQYILGPDSGWQPIPLTEVITAAAVKKAYRKATLYVHPDKLQQRGANIQQKYICGKIFDLLKEAWNRFNSEEP